MTALTRRRILIGAGAAAVAGLAGTASWRLAVGSMTAYEEYTRKLRTPLSADPPMTELVRYAALAANGHNTQPWRFRIGPDRIDILPDFGRRTPIVDPDDHHLYVSLGCAAENLCLAAAATGRRPMQVGPGEGAALAFEFAPMPPTGDALFGAIPLRQSTRAAYDGRAVPPDELDLLAKAGTEAGVALVLVTDRPAIGRIRDLVASGNRTQMSDPAFMAELKQWLRFSGRSAMEAGDGLYSAASGNPVLPDAIGRLAFDLFIRPDGESETYARQIDSSPGLAAFLAESADPQHWIAVGRACQRFTLQATALGLKVAFVNQPVEVASLRGELASLVGMAGRRPDLLLRFGYGPTLPYSPRRPVEAVLA